MVVRRHSLKHRKTDDKTGCRRKPRAAVQNVKGDDQEKSVPKGSAAVPLVPRKRDLKPRSESGVSAVSPA